MKKGFLESLPVTIFAIHGNHEQRPQTIETYKEKMWHGGMVYYEEEYRSHYGSNHEGEERLILKYYKYFVLF